MKLWLMLIGEKGTLRYVKAEAPCWKGEIVIPFFGDCIVFGWQRSMGDAK